MTWEAATEIIVGQSGADRYRWLCSEANPDAWSRSGYRALMIRRATGQPEPPPAPVSQPSPPDPWLPLIRACPDYNPACCSNPAPWCSRFDLAPPRERCIDCLTADGIGPGYRATTP